MEKHVLTELLEGFAKCLCIALEIDDSIPKLQMFIPDKDKDNLEGFYNFEEDIICFNKKLIDDFCDEFKESVEQAKNSKWMPPTTPGWIKIIEILSHEMKHREQHFHSADKYKNDFEISSKLNYKDKNDLIKYSNLSSEIDAKAFSTIGVLILLKEPSIIFSIHSDPLMDEKKYTERLVELLSKYGSYLKKEVLESIVK